MSPTQAARNEWREQFCARFGVPSVAETVIDLIVTPAEQAVILALPEETFSSEDAAAIAANIAAHHSAPLLVGEGALPAGKSALPAGEGALLAGEGALSAGKSALPASYSGESFAVGAYRRGIINRADSGDTSHEKYRVADFYTRLDVFAITERETCRAFDTEIRRAIDAWYFDTYYRRLTISSDVAPGDDAVLTLDEAIALIENETRQVYVTNCDCRSLAQGLFGACDKPLRTCISYRAGLNSGAHRGFALPVSKNEAKQVLFDTDKAGLIHTGNAHGICNCCTDCCYQSRARARRNAELGGHATVSWPRQTKAARQADTCINCGVCVTRCPFGLFSRDGGAVRLDTARAARFCVGCGLCVNACPSKALSLIEKKEKEK
jgi:Pyruvate/2-oxoacid:ferredoxin oxidoreductase delta subunit